MNDELLSSLKVASTKPVLAPEGNWPQRTQRLVGELRVLCSHWLHEPLRCSIDHFDMRLQQQAEHTGSHLDQQCYLTTRRLLLSERQAFELCFIASIDQAFVLLGTIATESTMVIPQLLTLLDPLEHELAATLDQLVARSEARSGQPLVELGFRLAALVGRPPIESDALPIGPQAMTRAFREASLVLGLPIPHELLLLQSLESSLIQGLASLHELANSHLRTDGILPCLRPFAVPRATARSNDAKNEKAPPIASPVAAISIPHNQQDGQTHPQVSSESNSLIGCAVTDQELQAALAVLQDHLIQMDEQTRIELNQPRRLREELLIQINVGRPEQAMRAILSTEQDDTLALIMRLFGQMTQQLPQTNHALLLLYDLQLSTLRVALIDHECFDQPEHPARQVLGKLTKIASDWLDTADVVTDFISRTKLRQLVERASRASPSVALYVSLQDDIEEYLARLPHKTQVAERRQIEAMQGFDRLEQARHRTIELLARRFANTAPEHRQLDHAWSDVLALTLLRHGEKSEVFGAQLAVTDQLLGLLPTGNRHKLQHEVEAGLRQTGLPNEEVIRRAKLMIDVSRP